MANADFNEDFNKRKDGSNPPKAKSPAPAPGMPMRTANWPGIPGKPQSKDRSGGVKKLKIHPDEKGL